MTYAEQVDDFEWHGNYVNLEDALRLATEADAEVSKLKAECDALRADAGRYRWLKSVKGLSLDSKNNEWFRTDGTSFISTHYLAANGTNHASYETLDRTIDAAIDNERSKA